MKKQSTKRWAGIGLFGLSFLATAGIYTLFPATSLVFVVLAGVGGYLFAK